MSDFCTFEEFFAEHTGHQPYLWQSQAAGLLAGGQVPEAIDVTTGMGKTMIIACWLWALAKDQHELALGLAQRRRVQTRLHLVVDRRLLVDSAADVADDLALALEEAYVLGADGAVGQVARSLAPRQAADGTLLSVRRLRGGLPVRAEHVRDPQVPAVVTSTVDMLGSRLLWRGYGVSPARRSIDAALVGADSLIVLDEAHLVPQFQHLLDDLSAQGLAQEGGFAGHIPPRRVLAMTATQHGARQSVLCADMAAERQASPWLDVRRAAREATEVTYEPETSVEQAALGLIGALAQGQSGVVFCNSVGVALSLTKKLTAQARRVKRTDLKVVTVIGGVPQPVREKVLGDLRPYMTGTAGRDQAPPTIVVSTQALEVGADLDFDLGISQVAPLPALVQRLGRVNRVGARHVGRFLIVGAAEKTSVYGSAPAAVEAFLQDRMGQVDDVAGFLDMVDPVLGDPDLSGGAKASEMVGLGPAEFAELLDTHNEATALDVGVLIRPSKAQWQCQVVFREGLEGLLEDDAVLGQYLELVPLRRWEQWSVSASAGSPAMKALTDRTVVVLRPDATVEVVTSFNPKEHAGSQLVGATLLLEQDSGLAKKLIDGFGSDVSGVRVGGEPAVTLVSTAGIDTADEDRVDELVMRVGFDPDAAELVELTGGLALVREVPAARVHAPGVRVGLEAHNGQVAELASTWARGLGMPQQVVESIELAGERHDLGKSDPGFQYLLHLSLPTRRSRVPVHVDDGMLLAKSDLPGSVSHAARWLARRDGGLLPGFRHEALSVELSRDQGYEGLGVDVELVEYLIATHHGHWQGLGPAIEGEGVPALQDASQPTWASWPQQLRDLQRRYGPYTLALAQALVRLADWECSARVIEEGS